MTVSVTVKLLSAPKVNEACCVTADCPSAELHSQPAISPAPGVLVSVNWQVLELAQL